jgi:hypothetical protein
VEIGVTIDLVNLDLNKNKMVLKKSLESFQGYAKGRKDGNLMSAKAAEITGLERDFIAKQNSLSLLFKNFIEHINKVCEPFPGAERCMVAYNGVNYDIPLLCADLECVTEKGAVHFFRQLCIEKMIDILFVSRTCLDSCVLKRNAKGNCSFKLGDVYIALFDEQLTGAHGAIQDAKAVSRIIIENENVNSYVCSMFQTNFDCKNDKEMSSIMQLVRNSVKKFDAVSEKSEKLPKLSVLQMMQNAGKTKKHKV